MPRYHARRLLPFARDTIFSLVADVERYPEFLPWWTQARVIERLPGAYRTDQSLGIGPLTVRFPSHTRLEPPERIEVVARHGPVRDLHLVWRFEAPAPDRCLTRLDMTLALASPALDAMVGRLHRQAAVSMVEAFEKRAHALFGTHGRNRGALP